MRDGMKKSLGNMKVNSYVNCHMYIESQLVTMRIILLNMTVSNRCNRTTLVGTLDVIYGYLSLIECATQQEYYKNQLNTNEILAIASIL